MIPSREGVVMVPKNSTYTVAYRIWCVTQLYEASQHLGSSLG